MTTKIERKEGRKEKRISLFEGRTKSIVLSLFGSFSLTLSLFNPPGSNSATESSRIGARHRPSARE